MPTRGRSELAQRAVECFLSQTYVEKELVILDDADSPSFPGPMPHVIYTGVQYHRLNHRYTIGAKRNMCCSRANGDILIHWDSDDWSHPERIADQVERLATSPIGFTGYHSMLFEDLDTGKKWKYCGDPHYALGTSFCYTREFWEAHPFPDVNKAEDNAIVSRISGFPSVDAGELVIASIHAGNTSQRAVSNSEYYRPVAA